MRYLMRASALTVGAALLIAYASTTATLRAAPRAGTPPVGHAAKSRISGQHVIVLVQENRSLDNLFQGFPGANTQNYGYDSHGNKVTLVPEPLGIAYDPGHGHSDFVAACNAPASQPGVCRGNGFNMERCHSKCPSDIEYTYVQQSDIQPYLQLAAQYALADEVLQQNEGPSFPAHIYLIAGQSGSPGSHWYISENPKPRGGAENCLASSGHTVLQIDMTTPYPGVEGNPIFPCVDPPTIMDELDQAGISWKYYTPFRGSIWTSPLAIKHLARSSSDSARVVTPNTKIFTDISNQTLPAVSYVIPTSHDSDHPGKNDPNGGPAWVASIVDAVGSSPYWSSTTILVVWDDWGGWFDHVMPAHATDPFGGNPDPYEYGFRVPLLAIGANVKSGYVSHTPRSAASILTFIESVYGLPSLGELDAQTDNLSDMFTSSRAPRRFKHIDTNGVTIRDLLRRPPDLTPVDEE